MQDRIKAALSNWNTDPFQAVTLLDELMESKDDHARVEAIGQLLPFKEAWDRRVRGLPPQHLMDGERAGFEFNAVYAKHYSMFACSMDLHPHACCSNFLAGDMPSAQSRLDQFKAGAGDHVWASIDFEDCDKPPTGWEAFEGSFPKDRGGPIYLLACDGVYWDKFGQPLLRSIFEADPQADVHVHLMDPGSTHGMPIGGDGGHVSKSIEHPRGDAVYYHAMRFVVLWQLLGVTGRPVWLLDVDALMLNQMPQITGDIAVRVRPGRFEPWNQFNAAVVGVKPTTFALRWTERVAAYILRKKREGRLRWGVDQYAMWWAAHYMPELNIKHLGEDVVGMTYRDDSAIWCNSGKEKHQAFLPRERLRFQERFDRYSATT